MKTLLISLAFVCLLTAESTNLQTQLNQLRSSYERTVQNLGAGSTTDLDSKYTAAVQRTLSTASETDKAELQTELTRLGEKQPLPADDSDAGPTLKKLRSIYRQQLQPLAAQREKATSDLKTRYLAELKKLGSTLKKGSPEMALIENELADAGASTAQEPGKLTPYQAQEQLLGWCIRQCARVMYLDGTREVDEPKLTILPRRGIKILGIVNDDSDERKYPTPTEAFPWVLVSTAAPLITRLNIKSTEGFTPADCEGLGGLDNLASLHMGSMAEASVAAYAAFPVLPRLGIIEVACEKGSLQERCELYSLIISRCPNIGFLYSGGAGNVLSLPIVGQTLARLPKLEGMNTRAHGNSGYWTGLAKSKSLRFLQFFSGDGSLSVADISQFTQLERLVVRDAASIPDLFQALPAMSGLASLGILYPLPYGPAEAATLLGMKNLSHLHLVLPADSDAFVDEIVKIKRLTRLGLEGPGVTDAVILKLKALTKLEAIELKDHGAGAGSIAELQKALPKLKTVSAL